MGPLHSDHKLGVVLSASKGETQSIRDCFPKTDTHGFLGADDLTTRHVVHGNPPQSPEPSWVPSVSTHFKCFLY